MKRARARHGFTLIELALVMAILGVLATAAVLKLTPLLAGGRLEDAIGQVAEADRLTRHAARRTGRSFVLHFDRRSGEITRDDGEGDGWTLLARMPRGFGIAAIRVGGGPESSTLGEVAVSTEGYGPTYAVHLRGNDGKGVWLLVAGLTGQVSSSDDGNGAPDLQAILSPRPSDAPAGADAP